MAEHAPSFVERLRLRYQALFRQEIAHTVRDHCALLKVFGSYPRFPLETLEHVATEQLVQLRLVAGRHEHDPRQRPQEGLVHEAVVHRAIAAIKRCARVPIWAPITPPVSPKRRLPLRQSSLKSAVWRHLPPRPPSGDATGGASVGPLLPTRPRTATGAGSIRAGKAGPDPRRGRVRPTAGRHDRGHARRPL